MALSVVSLAYAVCRLRTGTAATLHLRRDRLWRHAAYVAAFFLVWLWPVVHALTDFYNHTQAFTILDAVAVSGQGFLFACIRLSEPGAWAVIRGIVEPLLRSYGWPGESLQRDWQHCLGADPRCLRPLLPPRLQARRCYGSSALSGTGLGAWSPAATVAAAALWRAGGMAHPRAASGGTTTASRAQCTRWRAAALRSVAGRQSVQR